jgi:hypothetical protein
MLMVPPPQSPHLPLGDPRKRSVFRKHIAESATSLFSGNGFSRRPREGPASQTGRCSRGRTWGFHDTTIDDEQAFFGVWDMEWSRAEDSSAAIDTQDFRIVFTI